MAEVERVIPKPDSEKRYLALIGAGSFLSFVEEVPRLNEERPWDMAQSATDGSPATGCAVLLVVRRLSEADLPKSLIVACRKTSIFGRCGALRHKCRTWMMRQR